MSKNQGLSLVSYEAPNFVDDHPTVMGPVTLASTSEDQELVAGTVLAKLSSGSYTPWVHDGTDGVGGTQEARAILVEDVFVAAGVDEKASVYKHGAFLRAGLTWDETAEDSDILAAIADLEGVGIYVK